MCTGDFKVFPFLPPNVSSMLPKINTQEKLHSILQERITHTHTRVLELNF